MLWLLLLVPGFSEVMPDPAGADNNLEFVEFAWNEPIENMTNSDNVTVLEAILENMATPAIYEVYPPVAVRQELDVVMPVVPTRRCVVP